METKDTKSTYKWPYIITVLELLFSPLLVIIGTNVLDKVEEVILISIVGLVAIISIIFLGIDMLKHHKKPNTPLVETKEGETI